MVIIIDHVLTIKILILQLIISTSRVIIHPKHIFSMPGIPPACQRGITHQNDRSNGQTVIPQPVSHDQRKSMQKQQHTQAGVFTRQLLQHTGGNMEKETAAKKIAYQNKDITSKVLAERFQGKTFCVYGLDLPVIIQAAIKKKTNSNT